MRREQRAFVEPGDPPEYIGRCLEPDFSFRLARSVNDRSLAVEQADGLLRQHELLCHLGRDRERDLHDQNINRLVIAHDRHGDFDDGFAGADIRRQIGDVCLPGPENPADGLRIGRQAIAERDGRIQQLPPRCVVEDGRQILALRQYACLNMERGKVAGLQQLRICQRKGEQLHTVDHVVDIVRRAACGGPHGPGDLLLLIGRRAMDQQTAEHQEWQHRADDQRRYGGMDRDGGSHTATERKFINRP